MYGSRAVTLLVLISNDVINWGLKPYIQTNILVYMTLDVSTGFIRVREMSGKFKFFQGQGIVREFYVVSGKN